MLDRSLLPPATLEFVVLADTHFMEDPGPQKLEFESRRLQTDRVEHALRLISSLSPEFAVHLGDLTQLCADARPPEAYERAVAGAQAQLRRADLTLRYVAGNQDIGDKPDPTMPNAPATSASLDAFHARFGPSWYSWDAAGCHFVVLNSQVMNTPLPEAEEQRRWLESDLARSAGRRLFVFLHLPLYLYDPREPHLGHYDNLGQPARGWLLSLLEQHPAEMIFSGHSHYFFFDRIGATRYFVTPSTSFTRPGFGELFSAPPPDDRGRNDVGKVGFFLVRVQDDGSRVHFIRTKGRTRGQTEGVTSPPGEESPRRGIVTRLSRDLPRSPLGVTLRHPLVQVVDVPSAWPSLVRQRVRNDYPLLSCLELGVRHVRVPVSDLTDDVQRRGLQFLRDEGIGVSAVVHWDDSVDLREVARVSRGLADTIEIQVLGAPLPSPRCLEGIGHWPSDAGIPLALSAAVPGEQYSGRQLPRTRIGYRVDELARLDGHLARSNVRVDRVLCRVSPAESLWKTVSRYLAQRPLMGFRTVDWLVELPADDGLPHVSRAAEALFSAALARGSRVYLEPLVDLDRTMDVSRGLLDRLCNPRPAYDAVRVLNSALFSSADTYGLMAGVSSQPGLLRIKREEMENEDKASECLLYLPRSRGPVDLLIRSDGSAAEGRAREIEFYDLAEGTTDMLNPAGSPPSCIARRVAGPALIAAPSGSRTTVTEQ